LFVGKTDMDVAPYINELHSLRDEAEFDFADEPTNAKIKHRAEEIDDVLRAATAFHEEYNKAPPEMFKANFMLQGKADGPKPSMLLNAFKKKS